MKKIAALLLIVCLCATFISGCGTSSSASTAKASDSSASATLPATVKPSAAAPSAAPKPSPKSDLDLIVGKYVGVFSMSSGKEKGATFTITKGSDGSYSATEVTYPLAKYSDQKPTTYTCEVTYKDGYYSIKELSNDSQTSTSTMTYYKLTLDGDVLEGDNVRYSDGTSIGKIAIKRADAFEDLAGSYSGSASDTNGDKIGLDIDIQPSSNGAYEALCSFYPTASNPDVTPGVERCLVTYYYGDYYLVANAWVKNPGNSSLIDMEFTPAGKSLSGSLWVESSAPGDFKVTQ